MSYWDPLTQDGAEMAWRDLDGGGFGKILVYFVDSRLIDALETDTRDGNERRKNGIRVCGGN